MNRNQRMVVATALCVIATVLAFTFLVWSHGHISNAAKFVVFYTNTDPSYPGLVNYWGIYIRHGLAGYLLGLIAPVCLLAVAAFVALGRPSSGDLGTLPR